LHAAHFVQPRPSHAGHTPFSGIWKILSASPPQRASFIRHADALTLTIRTQDSQNVLNRLVGKASSWHCYTAQ
jgi:hypothetical protein